MRDLKGELEVKEAKHFKRKAGDVFEGERSGVFSPVHSCLGDQGMQAFSCGEHAYLCLLSCSASCTLQARASFVCCCAEERRRDLALLEAAPDGGGGKAGKMLVPRRDDADEEESEASEDDDDDDDDEVSSG